MPKKVIEVNPFMGLEGYYERLIKGFSRIAHPITSLQRKNANFIGLKSVEKDSNN